MLRSVDIELKLPEGTKLHSSMGSVMHGALMCDIVDRDTADWLHDLSTMRPYSQSVFWDRERSLPIWRVCTLTGQAEERVIEPLLKSLGNSIFLQQKGYDIELVKLAADYSADYGRLADEVFLAENSPREFSLRFLTVGSFKHDGSYMVFPDLRMLYSSLQMKWNAFSPSLKIEDKDLASFLADTSSMYRYRLSSQPFSLESQTIYGFAGEMSVRLQGSDMSRRLAALLMKLAPYTGIGIKTALGMGAVRSTMR